MADGPPEREKVLRDVLSDLNRTISVIRKLERDPPITEIAHLQMMGVFKKIGLSGMEVELFKVLSGVNDYRSRYWRLERSIMQAFLSYMGRKRFLPSNSPEINTLKAGLPRSLITGDDQIWTYSYDQYITKISELVGKRSDLAPKGKEAYDDIYRKFSRDIDQLISLANELVPSLGLFCSRIRSYIRSPDQEWYGIKGRKPRVKLVQRSIHKLHLIKRPLPIQGAERKGRIHGDGPAEKTRRPGVSS
ncbi:MAG: hypothetical protein JXA22_04760 [Candidatus Thermoplasmatota archaeon]|nr:hypothetical protein [Candidatus Thermoplasmatota archaeon]